MGLWKKMIQGWRRSFLLPGENYGDRKHGECSHFDKGRCLVMPRAFKGRKIDPKWPACIHFKAKNNHKI